MVKGLSPGLMSTQILILVWFWCTHFLLTMNRILLVR
ncbi:hypothetical protein NC652_011466 [Populus alba x Populus x berolinensis]|nr:hypothetical protein NC652_011466 [Populus alba x Populus x berolinensis]